MKRKEYHKQIIDLMIQIYDVYRKYNQKGKYISMFIKDGFASANNAYYKLHSVAADHPLDIYYVIK